MGKLEMSLSLEGLPERAGRSEPAGVRRIRPGDEQGLAELMLEAYRGTVDDEGSTLEDALKETKATLSGRYGRLLWEHSFLVEEGCQALLCASLVTSFEGAPLLAFSMTRPSHKRQGLAGALILQSARSLREAGHEKLLLFVTEENLPARKLYEKLGFQVVS
ncbi:MAG: GNAT family N-acetyltransferase [Chloroflexota bacterium]|nr:GNAT family N-acetyltransferase [Chloroflexota bacterium]